MSLRTLLHGTVMWMPLAGRMERGLLPSSWARTSSDQTPPALTIALQRTVISSSSARTRAPTMAPRPSLSIPISDAPLAIAAPKSSAAVRATVSVSRASSAWAS